MVPAQADSQTALPPGLTIMLDLLRNALASQHADRTTACISHHALYRYAIVNAQIVG